MKELDNLRIKYKKYGYALLRYDDGSVHSYLYDSTWLTDKKFNKLSNLSGQAYVIKK
jgi:hypothetical protein